jgi:hypothetical protein
VSREFAAFLVSLSLLIGCGKAPQPAVSASRTPPSSQPDFSGINTGNPAAAGPEQLSQANPAVAPDQIPASTPGAVFHSQAANEALGRYTAAREALRQVPPPAISQNHDLVNNPGAITGYIGEVNARLEALRQEENNVEQNLSDPAEHKRFKQLQKSLENSGDD